MPLHLDIEVAKVEDTLTMQERIDYDQTKLWEKMQLQAKFRIEECCQYIKNRRNKTLLDKIAVNIRSEGRDLTITRILGHKKEIPGSGRWQMMTAGENRSCWACSHWCYTLIFWHEDIGALHENSSI